MAPEIRIRRVYDAPSAGEGRRVLVDRIWPRGVSKAELTDVLWLKAVAPSAELRRWFGHDPRRWPEFRRRYETELQDNPALEELRALAREGPLTLLYAARDKAHNNALVLAQALGGPGDQPAT